MLLLLRVRMYRYSRYYPLGEKNDYTAFPTSLVNLEILDKYPALVLHYSGVLLLLLRFPRILKQGKVTATAQVDTR
jgi:hypothetical protein